MQGAQAPLRPINSDLARRITHQRENPHPYAPKRRTRPHWLGLCVIMVLGCRTVEPSQTNSASTGTITGAGIASMLELDKTDEQSLYLTMLQVELNAGVKVPRDQLHAVAGLAACSKANGLPNCNLRVRLGSSDLSATQPLERRLSEQIITFVQQVRPEFSSENLSFVDVICHYVGKASPPYKIEDVECRIVSPRTINESIFDETSAEELADLLRGDTSFGDAVMTISGTIACQAIPQSARQMCVVRSIQHGVLAEQIREVSAKHAGRVATALFQSLKDLIKLEKRDAPKIPREVVASLTCVVDSTRVTAEGRRQFKCRAAL